MKILIWLFLVTLTAQAQLAVTIASPKITGQKALVGLKMKNNLGDKVELARASCFLLDGQGQMVGQSTQWVIGQNKTTLDPKAETTFNFVIPIQKSLTTTNLTAKVSFSRVVLDGGKVADVRQSVTITGP